MKHLVQTQSHVKSSGIDLPEVHGISKGINPNTHSGKQVMKPIAVTNMKEVSQIKSRLGQGRAGLRCKIKTPIPNPKVLMTEKSMKQPKFIIHKMSRIWVKVAPIPNHTNPHIKSKDDSSSRMVERKAIQNISREIPISPDPVYRPPPKLVKTPTLKISGSLSYIDPEFNTDIKENLPFQEVVISEIYLWPDQSYFQEPQELESLINTGRLVQKFLLKQADIDKILKVIQRKILKGMHLPVTVK